MSTSCRKEPTEMHVTAVNLEYNVAHLHDICISWSTGKSGQSRLDCSVNPAGSSRLNFRTRKRQTRGWCRAIAFQSAQIPHGLHNPPGVFVQLWNPQRYFCLCGRVWGGLACLETSFNEIEPALRTYYRRGCYALCTPRSVDK